VKPCCADGSKGSPFARVGHCQLKFLERLLRGPFFIYNINMKYIYELKLQNFLEAREFSRSLNLKSKKDWDAWCKDNIKPNNIPVLPNVAYKNKGWVSYKDWLGY
jgi:hypothetical protein